MAAAAERGSTGAASARMRAISINRFPMIHVIGMGGGGFDAIKNKIRGIVRSRHGDILPPVHRLRIGALRQSDGPASQPFRTDSGFRLGKSAEHGLGRSLSRGFGLDRWLVHRLDAQYESERVGK